MSAFDQMCEQSWTAIQLALGQNRDENLSRPLGPVGRKPAAVRMENHHALDSCCDSDCFMAFEPILGFERVHTNPAASGAIWCIH